MWTRFRQIPPESGKRKEEVIRRPFFETMIEPIRNSSLLLLLFLTGCQVMGETAGGRAGRASDSPGYGAGSFRPVTPEPQWTSDGSDSYARIALLVTADRYQLRPSWRLPPARANGRALARVLRDHCGFADDAIRSMRAEDVTGPRVENMIRRLAELARPDTEVLFLLYYAGHGWVDSKGDQQFFTYLTDEVEAGGSFTHTMARSRILHWLAKARSRAETRGAKLTPVLVADACRTSTAAPPGRARISPSKVWELYSAREGRFAEMGVKSEPSPFTAGLVSAVESLFMLGSESSLDRVFQEALTRTKETTRNQQIPQILSPRGAKAPTIVVPGRVRFTLRLFDAMAPTVAVPAAQIRIDDKVRECRNGELEIHTSQGPHEIAIQAADYLSRTVSLNVDQSKHGHALRIALQPQIFLLEGTVRPESASVLVRWRGGDAGVRPDYHRTTSVSERGRFELWLPELEGELEFLSGDEVIHRQRVPTDVTARRIPDRPQLAGYDGLLVATVDVELPADSALAEVDDEMPEGRPEFESRNDEANWEFMLKAVQGRRYQDARDYLMLIRSDDPSIVLWQDWVDQRWAARAARTGLARGQRTGDWREADRVIEWARAHPALAENLLDAIREIEQEHIGIDARRLYQGAMRADSNHEFEEALRLFEELELVANDHYRGLARKAITRIREHLYRVYTNAGDQALGLGNTADAVGHFIEAVRVNPHAAPRLRSVLERHDELRNTEIESRARDALVAVPDHGDELASDLGVTFRYVDAGDGFWIATTEITRKQWSAVLGSKPRGSEKSRRYSTKHAQPVNFVSLREARAWCEGANLRDRKLPEGFEYRIPTRTQWVVACQAGADHRYSFGDDSQLLPRFAWFKDNAQNKLQRVGLKDPNAWGLYDMHGNVAEWCIDESRGNMPLSIGGSYLDRASACATDTGLDLSPGTSGLTTGFRPVLMRK